MNLWDYLDKNAVYIAPVSVVILDIVYLILDAIVKIYGCH